MTVLKKTKAQLSKGDLIMIRYTLKALLLGVFSLAVCSDGVTLAQV